MPVRALLALGVGAALAGIAFIVDSQAGDAGGYGAPEQGVEVPVTAMDQAAGPANNSPTLVADPTDHGFVALANRLDGPDFSCALHLSGDGGRSWAQAAPVPELPPGAEKCYAPEIAFDGSGKLYYLFVGLAGRGNEPMGAFLTSSADHGRTFSRPEQVLGPLNFSVRMAVDRTIGRAGRIHLAWIKATSDPPLGGFGPPPNPILSSYSDDGGRTFSPPVQVNDRERVRVVAPTLVVGPGHRVHVGYYDLGDDAVDYQGLEGPVWEGTWSVLLATANGGEGGFRESVVEASVVPPERVMLIFTMTPPAVAVRGEWVCLAWTDARRGDPDVLARCSNDGGMKWSGARRLNDDRLGNGLSQLMPRLAFSPEGRLDAIFYDRRRDRSNLFNYVFFTFSADGGRTWAPNVRLTRHASNSRVGPEYANPSAKGQVEFGSRLGLLSRQGGALAAWADTRNSPPNTKGQDVFTTIVRLPRKSSTSSGAAMVGGGLAVLGSLMILAGVRGRSLQTPARPLDDHRTT